MKKRMLGLIMTVVMLMTMVPFAQIVVSAEGEVTKTFDELIGNYINTGLTSSSSGLSFDTAAEFATMSGFDSETMTTTDDVLTMPATEGETAVNKSFVGFPVGSALHVKIDGFVGSNSKNNTSKPGVVLFYDNAYLLMLPFNDVEGVPSLRGLTADGWTGLTDGIIDTTQPFEILVKRIGTTENEVWAKQDAVTGDDYQLLATVNASASANGNVLYLKSGNNQGIKFDYAKIYYNNEVSVVGALKGSLSASGYNTLNYYRKACGITDKTWAEFNSLTNKDAVYAMDTTSITTALEFGTAFTAVVEKQKMAEIGPLTSFDELIGADISKGLVSNKVTLDTAEELSAAFPSSNTTDGILTMPTENTELALSNKTDGFPVGSALHFKVDGFSGSNTNASDRPGVVMYWLDSNSPKAGYYFMLKFKDVNGSPALHFGGTSIQPAFLDTTEPFEVLVKRIATQEVEIYARPSASQDAGYMKLATQTLTSLAHMNQIAIRSGNGQSIKLDYLKVYQNNEAAIVGVLKSSLNAEGYNNLNYYRKTCGITDETWTEFHKLANRDGVYQAIDVDSVTTVEEFGEAFTLAVAEQKAAEIGALSTFDEIIGAGIDKGTVFSKISLDTAEELSEAFPSSDTTDGVLTMPGENTELTLNNKTDGFPVGSALHFKVDGFVGTNTNGSDRPGIVMYWLDSASPKVGYYFMLKFKDVNGTPALHFGGNSIQSAFLDTTAPFEVLAKRTATEAIEIYARSSENTDAGYMKLGIGTPSSVAHMNQILVRSGNGQGIKFDYIKFYQNNETGIIDVINSTINDSDYTNTAKNISYYKTACEISDETMSVFNTLKYPNKVFDAMKPANYTTCAEIGVAFSTAVTQQNSYEDEHAGDLLVMPSLTKTGDRFIASVQFENYLEVDDAQDVVFVVALYGENDRLLSLPINETMTITKDADDTLALPDVSSQSGVKYARFFIWDGTTKIKPLCNSIMCSN